jgi:hypothetical protein
MRAFLKKINLFVELVTKILIYVSKLRFSLLRSPQSLVFLEMPIVKYSLHILFLFQLLFMSSCKKDLSPAQYVSWVKAPENGLVQTKQLGEFTFTVMHKPAAYMALQAIGGEQDANKSRFDEELKAAGSMLYFTFRVKHAQAQDAFMAGMENEQQYGLRIGYFMGDAQQDFSLVNGTDTLPCTMYHYERDYGISKEESISLGFDPKNKPIKNLQLIYNDQQLGTGPVKVAFSEELLHSLPNPEYK